MTDFFETANLIEETLRVKSGVRESRKSMGTSFQEVEEVSFHLILDKLQNHEVLLLAYVIQIRKLLHYH